MNCPHCGRKMPPEYAFTFNRGLANILAFLYKEDRPIKTKSLAGSFSQYTNCAKLAYWGLAARFGRTRGWWRITEEGKKFMEGLISIHGKVLTQGGKVLGVTGKRIKITDVDEKYKRYGDYAAQAKAADPQMPLFG